MKSFARIHQQTLDILQGIARRRDQRAYDRFADRVIRAHNAYLDNICARFRVLDGSRLTPSQLNAPMSRNFYAITPNYNS
ncbi:MAG: hypothetical protein JFR41_05790 [Muribaculaceae bacterium]|nr:hypothetical protein [Muribaculaceae bacterium]